MRTRYRLRAALAILVALVLAIPLAAQQPPPRLRVLTYNIHHGEGTDGRFDYERLARIITAVHPDVVALQEVDRGTRRAHGVDQAKRLAALVKMHSAFGLAMHYSGGEYGEAILSRFPLSAIKAHHLPYRFGQEARTALEVRVRPDNGLPEFLFVGTHLCHQSAATRLEQTRQLDHLFPPGGAAPVVLAGDFNARRESPAMKVLLAKRWVEASKPQSIIDYVLVRSNDPWRVLEVRTLDEPLASDHAPVLVVLEWRPARSTRRPAGRAPRGRGSR